MVASGLPQLRVVDTPRGPLTYTLTRKRVKNLNLRVGAGNEIMVSIPCGARRGRRTTSFGSGAAGFWTPSAAGRTASWSPCPRCPGRSVPGC